MDLRGHLSWQASLVSFLSNSKVDENGVLVVGHYGYCGGPDCSDCPMHPNALTTDETLKVTHGNITDQKEIMISVRLIGIMSSSLILLALMMKGLGISGSEI